MWIGVLIASKKVFAARNSGGPGPWPGRRRGLWGEHRQRGTPHARHLEQRSPGPAQRLGSVETPSDKELIPVYWLQADNDGVYLYREYARAKASGDPVTDAISYMLNDKPAKDGWFTYLKPSTDIGVSISSENVITLDLPKKVFGAHLDEGLAQRSIQQLVFTATAAAANAGVLNGSQPPKLRLLVDGAANATVFDDYRLESEYERNSSFMAPIWIIDRRTPASSPPGRSSSTPDPSPSATGCTTGWSARTRPGTGSRWTRPNG